jgi:hypothetical protein
VLTEDEAKRFAPGETANPRSDITLAWELLYRLEPELYERLVAAERLHPGVLAWLPHDVERIVEVAAGTGRLTLELVARARGLGDRTRWAAARDPESKALASGSWAPCPRGPWLL